MKKARENSSNNYKEDKAAEDPKKTKSSDFKDKKTDNEGDNKIKEKVTEKNTVLEEEIQSLKKKLEENEDFTLRIKADFDNYKKRVGEERERIILFAGENILKHFLKIYDSYNQALAKEVKDEATRAFLEGFKLIKQEMDKFLEEQKVSASSQVGDHFNPHIHQAILFEESSEAQQEKISEIFQQGYLLNGRLLRVAVVKVLKPTAKPPSSEGESGEESPGGQPVEKNDEKLSKN